MKVAIPFFLAQQVFRYVILSHPKCKCDIELTVSTRNVSNKRLVGNLTASWIYDIRANFSIRAQFKIYAGAVLGLHNCLRISAVVRRSNR